MTLYKISNDKKGYTPSIFIVNTFGEIYVENREHGFFKHPTLTTEFKLQEHITRMNNDGCTVEVIRL